MANDLDQDLDDDKVINSEEDDDDDDKDEELVVTEDGKTEEDGSVVVEEVSDKTDDEREKIREARRNERHEMKARKKEKDERLRRELASERSERQRLEERISLMERKSSGNDMAQIDNTIRTTQQAYAYHKEQLSLATAQGNGAVAAEATEKLMLAKQRIDDLNRVKTAYSQKQAAPSPLDPDMVRNAQSWASKNPWYKPDGTDTDSKMMRQLDDDLVAQGWNPKTTQYWEELEERQKKYLPHRSTRNKVQQGNTIDRQRSIVSGSGRESAASSSAGTFQLSAARVNAMKEAGEWNDLKKRAEMVNYYRNYDRNKKNKE